MRPSAGSAAVAEYLSGKDARMLNSAGAVRTEQSEPAFLCYVRQKKKKKISAVEKADAY